MSAEPAPPPPLWEVVETAEPLAAALMADALTAMEINRARYMDRHAPAARRIQERAAELGRDDLQMRARLILADLTSRQGRWAPAAETIAEITEQARRAGYPYLQARGNFLLCVAQWALGDLPAARTHGVQSVELLPDDTPVPVRIDHVIMLAVVYGPGEDAAAQYQHALELAAGIGDSDKTISIHNNLAYTAWKQGDLEQALDHVQHMLSLSEARGIPLKASALDTVARVYMSGGRYADAIALLEPVIQLGEQMPAMRYGYRVVPPDPYALAECLLTLAEAYRLTDDLESATARLERSAAIATERDLRETAARIMEERSRQYAARGEWKSAYQEHDSFHRAAIRLHTAEQEARARAIQASYDADERERDSARFRELAIRDALTGLYNRRFIDTQMAALTAQSVASRTALSVAIVDADFFKRVNDEYSHDVGDRVLQTMASILQGAVVTPETVGRLGGEEFVVLMPGSSAAEALERCEQIRVRIRDHDWSPLVDGLGITVSIGVSTAANGQTSAAAILSDADRNLYAAKRSGRNRVMADTR